MSTQFQPLTGLMYDFKILTSEEYRTQLESGNDFACNESDIGLFVWNTGKAFFGTECLTRWVEQSKEDIENGRSYGKDDHEKYSMLLAAIERKNEALMRIEQQRMELVQIRHNLNSNMAVSKGLQKAYQKVSLEIVEKCLGTVTAVLVSLGKSQ